MFKIEICQGIFRGCEGNIILWENKMLWRLNDCCWNLLSSSVIRDWIPIFSTCIQFRL